MSEPPRSRSARDLAERALIRLALAYGGTPEFVLLGGLVPDLLCSQAQHSHVGTTDVDVQVNLELARAAVNAQRLEQALRTSGFIPDAQRIWRWKDQQASGAVVKVEFLADLDDQPNQATLSFNSCEHLGAVNLRGTRFAAQDWSPRRLTAVMDGSAVTVSIRAADLCGYLLAKTCAAHARASDKDWYDVAYVLLHNDDESEATHIGKLVRKRFGDAISGSVRTALVELRANFRDDRGQGTRAYVSTMLHLYPELDRDVLGQDATAVVSGFVAGGLHQ
ncbi:MAG: hypothetical protein GEU81_08850 [Nitriliruptorales bacterium]|nr:hypothetical protein [Nitriliruptorales bacterium]